MKFKIKTEIFDTFPTLIVAIPVVTNFNNKINVQECEAILRKEEINLKNRLSLNKLGKEKYVAVYLDAFKRFGVDPEKFVPAHLALSKRVLEGSSLPNINPAVDLYNALSIKYLTPFGGEDLNTVYGDFVLTFAKGGEQWIPIGAKKSKSAVKGELIWRDDFDLSTRALNWRQCERTKLTGTSKNGYFIMDGFSEVNKENITRAADEFIEIIKKMLGGEGKIYWLDKDHQEVEIPFQSKKYLATSKEKPQPKIYEGIKKIIQELLFTALKKYNVKIEDVTIEQPKSQIFGDYSTTIALKLTKTLNKSPLLIAEEIVKQLPIGELFEKIEVVKPGFVNFWLSNKYLSQQLFLIVEGKEKFGQTDSLKGKKVMVEYTDPNPFKEFHLGHLYSNIVGESLSKLYESQGANVKRVNYYGDVGMHVSKSIWGILQKFKNDGISIDELEEKTQPERLKYLGEAYALGTNEYEKNEITKEEIKDINYLVYVCGQEYLEKTQNWIPQVDYKQYISNKKFDFEEIKNIYFKGKTWTLDAFEEIYRRLGTKFDYYYPESIVGEYGAKIVKEGLKKGVFAVSKGAVIFKGEDYGLHTRVFINSLGLPTYEAKELGLAPTKYKDFSYDMSFIVTATEINEYFKVLLKALSLMSPDLAKKTKHVGHGMIHLPEGKMSSRTGNVITINWLLEEIKKHLRKLFSSHEKISKTDMPQIEEVLAIGAIKYSLLKTSVGKDVVFSFDESLSLQGNSGPYLQYTYARCKSVLSKADLTLQTHNIQFSSFGEGEKRLLRLFTQFPDVVTESTILLSPGTLCNYLFILCQEFNLFYQKNPILISEKNTKQIRLLITQATTHIIQNSLNLLGIKTVEKM